MVKILSQSGTSLADVYNVPGGVGAIDQLRTEEIILLHEMGGQIFSERLQSFPITMTTTAILQNVDFDIVAGGIPDSPNRILAIYVEVNAAGGLSFCQVGFTQPDGPVDVPLWKWDATVDGSADIRVAQGGAPANTLELIPSQQILVPNLMTRIGPTRAMPDLVFRGRSAGFGAGTVTANAHVLITRANPGAPTPATSSSHGLPLPGW